LLDEFNFGSYRPVMTSVLYMKSVWIYSCGCNTRVRPR